MKGPIIVAYFEYFSKRLDCGAPSGFAGKGAPGLSFDRRTVQHGLRKRRMQARPIKIIPTIERATMRTISTVVLPEEEGAEAALELAEREVELVERKVELVEGEVELAKEEIELVGDVGFAGPVGSEELAAVPMTRVVLVGTVSNAV